MSKRKKTPFAEDKDGTRYVEIGVVMAPLVAAIDGIPITFFGKEKTPYMKIDAAIEWCQREKKHHSKEKYEQIIAVLERAKVEG